MDEQADEEGVSLEYDFISSGSLVGLVAIKTHAYYLLGGAG